MEGEEGAAIRIAPWVTVAFAYVGAVVGAGFASGQEIYQFFTRHGRVASWGILWSGVLFGVLGWIALEAGRRGVTDFQRLLSVLYGSATQKVLNGIFTAFLVVGLVVVTAAGGADLAGLTSLSAKIGGFLTLAGVLGVATAGAQGVLRVNLILVPLLVVVTMIVALMAPTLPSADHSAPGWWISAGLFVSYNLFTGLVVLLGLGQQVSSGLESGLASGLAAIVLTALALVVHRALLSYGGETDIPLFWAAQSLGGGWPHLFGGALYAALFTTGVAEAFALQQRYGTRALAWSLGLWPFSWLGFSTLVAILYPIMGAFAVLFWLPLLCSVRSR